MISTYEFDAHPAAYPSDWRRAYVQRVVDGDTYYLRIDQGYHVAITVPVRLRGVDTPELSTARGREVRDLVRTLLEGQPIMARTVKDTQSFARWIADVQYYAPPPSPVAWLDLAQHVLAVGWGVVYP
ncbi:MAG TPA: hypothetical protein VGP44_06020 [Gemmatimonadales bacterium]|nr:hypothetical protein [Gemmatimonadales bacterium]